MIEKVNLTDKLSLFSDHWSPKVLGQVGDYHVKVAKFEGDFVWHKHENEDEMFLVIDGNFKMCLRDQEIDLETGEFIIIPKGVEHMPSAEKEVSVLLFEPKSTINTGSADDDRKVLLPQQV